MSQTECYDKIRFSLSDKSGVLRFETFAIVGAPECGDMEQELRAYLVGRPLSEVDPGYLRSLSCKGDGACMRAVIQTVGEYKELFHVTRNER